MKKTLSRLLFLVVFISSCSPQIPENKELSKVWQAKVDNLLVVISNCNSEENQCFFSKELTKQAIASSIAVDELHAGIPDCNSSEIQCHDFDANRYFEIFPRLSAPDGYVLDYIIFQGNTSANPMFYWRKIGKEPFPNESSYYYAEDKGLLLGNTYWAYLLEIEDSAEGYLDYAIFSTMHGQFYLYWHSYYADNQVVASSEQLERILTENNECGGISEDIANAARKMTLTPLVVMRENEVSVAYVLFTKWGGFRRARITISRNIPHEILDVVYEQEVKYECGIIY